MMHTFSFDETEMNSFFDVLAAILHLGNVTFELEENVCKLDFDLISSDCFLFPNRLALNLHSMPY